MQQPFMGEFHSLQNLNQDRYFYQKVFYRDYSLKKKMDGN